MIKDWRCGRLPTCKSIGWPIIRQTESANNGRALVQQPESQIVIVKEDWRSWGYRLSCCRIDVFRQNGAYAMNSKNVLGFQSLASYCNFAILWVNNKGSDFVDFCRYYY